MKAVSVTNTVSLVAAGGNRKFIHIYNASSATIYLQYDGDDTDDPTGVGANLTSANGFPLVAGAVLQLDNDGHTNVFDQPVFAVAAGAGPYTLNVQGA